MNRIFTFIFLMAAILDIQADKLPAGKTPGARDYFLPYQKDWILNEDRLTLWEKSFRIGATYADAFRNVRKRLLFPKRDYLFATRDYPSALEYMQSCKQACEIYNATKAIVSHGEDVIRVPLRDQNGNTTSFTEEIKIGYIKFDNGSRIIAFSSNPNAMLVYGGDVGMDEFPRHQRAEELYQIAQARVTWGYDLAMWGSHFGNDTMFYRLALIARRGQGGWRHFFTTIEDAVNVGLVELINSTRGTNFTREGFLLDCKNRAVDETTYQEAYMCNPRGGTAAIVPWSKIELCMEDYKAERMHLEAGQINELFGPYSPDPRQKQERRERIANFLRSTFPNLLAEKKRHTIGYDVAASGQGDLASISIDAIEADIARASGLFTFRTSDWDFHDTVLNFFMSNVHSSTGAGDGTGLGMKICWEISQNYPGRFESVNFSSQKSELGFSLMNRLSTSSRRWPREWQDVATDYFALRKVNNGNKWVFSAGTNNLNQHSHCDIAWSGALSDRAALAYADAGTMVAYAPDAGSCQALKEERCCLG